MWTKKKYLIAVMTIFTGAVLSGCGIKVKPVVAHQQLQQAYITQTKALLTTRGLIAKQALSGRNSDHIKLNWKSQRVAKQQLKIAQKATKEVDQKPKLTSAPKDEVQYGRQTSRYISIVCAHKRMKVANEAFHQADKQGAHLVGKYQLAKRSRLVARYTEIMESADIMSGYTLHRSKHQAAHEASERVLPENQRQMIKQSKSTKSLNHNRTEQSLEGVLVVICILLIIVIFLQPNRQDDAMNALTDSGGASLFTRPKPRGYALFLLRATEMLIAATVGILLVINYLI